MFKAIFSLVLTFGPFAHAVRNLTCEIVTIKYTQKVDTITNTIDFRPVHFKVDGSDNLIDKDRMLVISANEDQYLKGLYFALVTQGQSPISDDNGMAMATMIKRDQIVTARFFQDIMLTKLILKPNERVQSYLVGTSSNFNSLAKVRPVNRLQKDLVAAQFQLPVDFDFNNAMSLLLDAKFQNLLADLKYLPGTPLFVGLNSICLEGSR